MTFEKPSTASSAHSPEPSSGTAVLFPTIKPPTTSQISPSTALDTDPDTSFDELLPIQDTLAPSASAIPSSLSLVAFQDNILISFTRENLLRGVDDYPTLFQAPLTPSTLPLTSTSLLSLSTTYFALSHPASTAPSSPLLLARHARYTTALSAVNAALGAPPSRRHHPPPLDLLTAVTALALHEFLAPTSPAGWIAHCLGLARLFELWGPPAVARSPPARQLFETVRPVMVLAALAARQRSVFGEEAWRRVPWEGGGGATKDRVHVLLDVLAVASGLVEGRGLDGAGSVQAEAERRGLLEEARTLLAELDAWQAGWDRAFPQTREEVAGLVSSAPVGVDEDGLVGPLWRTVWRYGNLYFANVVALSDAVRIFLLMFVSAVAGPGTGVDQDGLRRELYEAATDICRSVDYHLLDFQDGAGSFFILFPLRMAWQAFGSGDSPEAKWVEQVMDGISGGTRGGRWTVANQLVRTGQVGRDE